MVSTKVEVGAFVLGGIVLFGVGLFLIGSREKVFNRAFDVYADFSTISGLASGAEVRVSGLQAGQLVEIQVPQQPSGEYRLKLRLEEKVHPLIRQDSMATIQTDGLVGDKFLEIDKGSDASPSCAAGCTIPTKEPFDLSDLIQSSHQLVDTTTSTLESVNQVADNVNEGLTQFLARNRNGKNGATELTETVASTRQAMSNLAEDTEALKHNFLLRGFFHSRGYFDLSELTPADYRTSKFVKSSSAKRVWLASDELFTRSSKGQEGISRRGEEELDHAMDTFVPYLPNRPIIVEGYANGGSPDEEYRVSQQRASAVEQYLEAHFHLSPSLVGEIPLEGAPPQATGKKTWDGVALVLLP